MVRAGASINVFPSTPNSRSAGKRGKAFAGKFARVQST
jgi:hypothetical protein